jgi:phosphoribosyl 1,2-cyclic phosphate phosphodiesterase
VPKLEFRPISTEPFSVLGSRVSPIRLKHGAQEILGFRIGATAYCTDVSAIPEASYPLLEGLDVLVLDALRRTPHPTHLSIDQAVEIARRFRPRRTLLTHMSHDVDYEAISRELPPGVELAYDGLQIVLAPDGAVDSDS